MLQIASGSTLDARKGPINEVVVFLFFAYVRGNQGISSVVNQDEMSQIEPGSALDLRWAQLMRPRSFFFLLCGSDVGDVHPVCGLYIVAG
jgi:hypothetical protein